MPFKINIYLRKELREKKTKNGFEELTIQLLVIKKKEKNNINKI